MYKGCFYEATTIEELEQAIQEIKYLIIMNTSEIKQIKIIKLIFLLLFTFSTFNIKAQCNKATKLKIDSLKAEIPYPQFNIGDTLYIAFITNPYIGIESVTKNDIEVKKVQIYEMKLYNNIDSNDHTFLGIEGSLPLKWMYQYFDTQIKSPKYKDRSDFYDEHRFSKTISGAIDILIKHN